MYISCYNSVLNVLKSQKFSGLEFGCFISISIKIFVKIALVKLTNPHVCFFLAVFNHLPLLVVVVSVVCFST